MIGAKDGTVLGTIDLGGVPEQGVGDGRGMLYVVIEDVRGELRQAVRMELEQNETELGERQSVNY